MKFKKFPYKDIVSSDAFISGKNYIVFHLSFIATYFNAFNLLTPVKFSNFQIEDHMELSILRLKK